MTWRDLSSTLKLIVLIDIKSGRDERFELGTMQFLELVSEIVLSFVNHVVRSVFRSFVRCCLLFFYDDIRYSFFVYLSRELFCLSFAFTYLKPFYNLKGIPRLFKTHIWLLHPKFQAFFITKLNKIIFLDSQSTSTWTALKHTVIKFNIVCVTGRAI